MAFQPSPFHGFAPYGAPMFYLGGRPPQYWTAETVTYTGPPPTGPQNPLHMLGAPAQAQAPAPEADKTKDKKPDKRYKTPDVSRVTIHVITIPAYASAHDLFRRPRGPPICPNFRGLKLPLNMSISDFFKEVGAFADRFVVEEAVEEGGGYWSRGTKLVWGCQDVTTLGGVRWKRGAGLSAAAEEPVWIVLRPKADGE